MDDANLKLRLLRALSGKTQEAFSEEIGVDAATYGKYELGLLTPRPDKVERAAEALGVGRDFAGEVLRLLDLHRQKRLRPGRDHEDLVEQVAQAARKVARETAQRLFALPPLDSVPRPEDRRAAREQLPLLLALPPGERAAVVTRGRDYRAWALSIEAAAAARAAADPEEAARWSSLAAELAGLAEDNPPGFADAIRSHALACEADLQQHLGHAEAARKAREKARRLWKPAADPDGVLGPPIL